jgi:hypothetical protein
MTDIRDYTMGSDVKFSDSYIEQASALPKNTSYTSDSIELGLVQSALSLKVVANTEVVIANTKILKIELYDSADNITFALAKTLLDYTDASGSSTTRAIGYEFVNFVPGDDIKRYVKIKVTTDSDLSAYKYDAYLRYEAR